MLGVGHVVTTSVGMCDIDIRPVIISMFWTRVAVLHDTIRIMIHCDMVHIALYRIVL